MSNLSFAPIGFPLLGLCLTLICYQSERWQKLISVIVSGSFFAFSLWLLQAPAIPALVSGGWPSPFGITLNIDGFSAVLLAVTGTLYLATCLYSQLGKTAENSPFYFPLTHALIAGVSGAFITSDLFNLYVWFEVTLLSSFVLMSLGHDKQRLAGSIKYVVLNIVSSLIFLISVGLIYGLTHTLDYSDLSAKLLQLGGSEKSYVNTLSSLLFVAFAIKAGLFPFYNWLPASYHTASPALSGLFAGLLTKVGLYAIFRVSTMVFPASDYLSQVVLILAPLTMLFGVLGAIVQTHIRRILSFHVISQVGYIALMGALVSSESALLREAGLAAAIFYMAHHMLVKTNLFFVSGLIRSGAGSERLSRLGNLRHRFPLLAILFAIPAMSLAGLPPSSGFWAKLALFRVSLSAEHFLAALVMVVAGFFTVFSMVKIWLGAFWKESDEPDIPLQRQYTMPLLACLLLASFSLLIGFAPDLLMEKAKSASQIAISQALSSETMIVEVVTEPAAVNQTTPEAP